MHGTSLRLTTEQKLKSNRQQTYRKMNNLGLYGGVHLVHAQLVDSRQSKQRPGPDGRLGSGIATEFHSTGGV
ncbi:hypothetical protein RB213_008194 [Colletotrichum asianum]|uniref:Uncharacterized protein n=1 Tax=Colletotrichum asianum TaxID=702518 RepID=A0A8H3WF25_9PEZI|nr:hypothetical protein GQ607_005861 [Colletotrichum asianum]